MKKELFAVLLLALLLILSLMNTREISALCKNLSGSVERTRILMSDGDFEGAEDVIRDALALWRGRASYTHCVLRHTDLESIDNAMFELLEAVHSHDVTAVVAAEETLEHLRALRDMESINLGSIF